MSEPTIGEEGVEGVRVRANLVMLQADHQDSPDTPRRTPTEVALAQDVLTLLATQRAPDEEEK